MCLIFTIINALAFTLAFLLNKNDEWASGFYSSQLVDETEDC